MSILDKILCGIWVVVTLLGSMFSKFAGLLETTTVTNHAIVSQMQNTDSSYIAAQMLGGGGIFHTILWVLYCLLTLFIIFRIWMTFVEGEGEPE